MDKSIESDRSSLIRNAVVFQLKLMADGLRDLVLLPVSLFATLIGLLRGGDDPQRELNQVIAVGRESEQWINLFGHHNADDSEDSKPSIDDVFSKVEEALKQQYKKTGTSERSQSEIEEALHAARDQAEK